MPAKRRAGKGRAHRITPEAVEAYRAGDWGLLHRLLGLKPWEASPLHVEACDPEASTSCYAASLPQALKLKEQLDARARDISRSLDCGKRC